MRKIAFMGQFVARGSCSTSASVRRGRPISQARQPCRRSVAGPGRPSRKRAAAAGRQRAAAKRSTGPRFDDGHGAGSLTANPNPITFEAGPLGPVLVSGVVSGLGLWQNNKFPDQQHSQASLSNGQVFFQKNDGLFQYFVQVGAYTLPALGTPYFSTATTTGDFFGPVPVAFASSRRPTIFTSKAASCRPCSAPSTLLHSRI